MDSDWSAPVWPKQTLQLKSTGNKKEPYPYVKKWDNNLVFNKDVVWLMTVYCAEVTANMVIVFGV